MMWKSILIVVLGIMWSAQANAGAPCNKYFLAPYHKMLGKWEGKFSKISPKGIVTERYTGITTVKLREVGESCQWVRKSIYTYFGGKKRIITYKGIFSPKQNLLLKQKQFIDSGKGWTKDGHVFLSTIDLKRKNQIFETTILMDENSRTRTWTHTNCESFDRSKCVNGKTRGLTMIVEKKVD